MFKNIPEKIYNNMRVTFPFLGGGFILGGVYGLLFPEDAITRVNGIQVTGSEEMMARLLFMLLGCLILVFRYSFLRNKR